MVAPLSEVVDGTAQLRIVTKFQNSGRTLMSWLKRLIPLPSKVFTDPEYQAAYEFKDSFVPDENRSYDWVFEYAKFNFEQLQNADVTLDKKAESIMRILGGGSGLLSLGALLNLTKIGFFTAAGILAALAFALAAVAVAAWVRVPRTTALPPSIAWATEYVSAYDNKSQDRFLAQWHLACEGIRLSLKAKSWGVIVATWFGVGSVGTLAISFFVALATIQTASPDSEGPAKMSTQNSHQTTPQNQSNVPKASTSAPDPSSQPQTPSSRSAASPQANQKSADPARSAGPQTIQFSDAPDSGRGIFGADKGSK